MKAISGNYTRFFTSDFNPASYGTHPDFSQYRPLHRAILEGDWESVESFYRSHPEAVTNSITESSDTALMVGIMSGQKIEFITDQVEFGRVDLRRVNKEGNTALHEAAIVGHLKAAELLVGRNRSLLYIRNLDGYLPLHLAAAYGQREILFYFLRVGEVHNIQLSESELDMLMHLEITARFFVPYVKHIQEIKSMHDRTKLFVRMFCWGLQGSPEHSSILKKAFLLGAKNGIQEIVEEILVVFPDAISYVDEEGHSALHLAVMYRCEHVFNFIIQQMGVRKKLLLKVDNGGNNILHLVGRMPYQPQLEVASSAVLQMQRELQWYKEVEKLVPVQATTTMNHDGKTPMMVFDEDHRRMIQSEEQWIVSLASACTVSTTIIGTIAFSAAIQVPGGDNDTGHPHLNGRPSFKLFAISNAAALYSAISTFLIFLSIFTTRYAAIDFLYSLPNRLIIGLISLFVSITSTIIAFGFAQYFMLFEEHETWKPISVVIMSFALVTLFAFLQFPLLLNMMKTTYGRSMFNLLDGRNSRKGNIAHFVDAIVKYVVSKWKCNIAHFVDAIVKYAR
ncbi:hypothetical protein HYC85_022703 [Camellia sinensis]|uniref:PGG domain-containing protein n=1 Tax=Camellia sinensis TaxID=4442 RepID=A0A7J7GGA8_CAMSI|nr:hypothetical protein HYC85_022703 [Camellia sinensis]